MAIQITAKGTKRSRRRIINEINVMPLIDIMLVLLVVFMVTAPVHITGIEVNLPQTNSKTMSHNDEPLVISIDKQGSIYIMNTLIKNHELAHKLKAITNEKYDTKIFIKADTDLNYGKIMQIMSQISNAGFVQVGLVSQTIDKK